MQGASCRQCRAEYFTFLAQRRSLYCIDAARSIPSDRQDFSFIFIIANRLMHCGEMQARFEDSIHFNHSSIPGLCIPAIHKIPISRNCIGSSGIIYPISGRVCRCASGVRFVRRRPRDDVRTCRTSSIAKPVQPALNARRPAARYRSAPGRDPTNDTHPARRTSSAAPPICRRACTAARAARPR